MPVIQPQARRLAASEQTLQPGAFPAVSTVLTTDGKLALTAADGQRAPAPEALDLMGSPIGRAAVAGR